MQPSTTYGAAFAEDSAARRAMSPLTNGGAGLPGEPDYSDMGKRNSNLLGTPDYSSVDETFAENHARLTAENTYIPQVVITGERMTPAQKEASLAEERMLTQYGSRAAWETAQFFKGAKDSVTSIPGAIAGAAKGAYGLATGDPAMLMRASQAWNRLSSMTVGGMIDAAGRGIVASSPLGIATPFASGDPYSAGGRAGMAVLGVAVPVAGRFGMDGLEAVGKIGASNVAGDALRYENYWDKLGGTPGSLNDRSARAWYLSEAAYVTFPDGYIGVYSSKDGPVLFVNNKKYLFTDQSWKISVREGSVNNKVRLSALNQSDIEFEYSKPVLDVLDPWSEKQFDDFYIWLSQKRDNREFIGMWTDKN
ncbi:MAG TPA: hypothetical protein VFG03_06455 [Telluria sp.]|nr:hypothetical protein [Telluria sp.]